MQLKMFAVSDLSTTLETLDSISLEEKWKVELNVMGKMY